MTVPAHLAPPTRIPLLTEPQWYLLARPVVILPGILIGGVADRRRSDAASLPV